MSLPKQFKSARMTNATLGLDIDDNVGDLELVLCDVFGFTEDEDITESPLLCDNAGRITKALLRQVAAGPVGLRIRDSSSGKEFRLALSSSTLLFSVNTGTEESPSWSVKAMMDVNAGTWTFFAIPKGPSSDPTQDDELTRKAFVAAQDAAHADAATAHSSATNLEKTANKGAANGYASLDSGTKVPTGQLGSGTPDGDTILHGDQSWKKVSRPYVLLRDQKPAGTDGGTFTAGAWQTRDLNEKKVDTDDICTLSSNQFTLPAGTYRFRITAPGLVVDKHKARLYNVTDAAASINGSNGLTSSTIYAATYSTVVGQVTIAAEKTFEVQHRCSTTRSNDGFGMACSFSVPEIYTQVEIWKIS